MRFPKKERESKGIKERLRFSQCESENEKWWKSNVESTKQEEEEEKLNL